jgi:hypothetical protein
LETVFLKWLFHRATACLGFKPCLFPALSQHPAKPAHGAQKRLQMQQHRGACMALLASEQTKGNTYGDSLIRRGFEWIKSGQRVRLCCGYQGRYSVPATETKDTLQPNTSSIL